MIVAIVGTIMSITFVLRDRRYPMTDYEDQVTDDHWYF